LAYHAAMTGRRRSQPARDEVLLVSLIAVAIGLVGVGFASHTDLRHLIQVAPAVVAAGLAARGDRRARFAAIPVFVLWFLIMLAIWLFLLGLAHVTTGHFSYAETALTVLIGAGCIAGMTRVVRTEPRVAWVTATITVLVFAALQIGCVWLSLQPMFATR
jgi:hypothetical protein